MANTRSPQAARQASTSLPADADWLTECPEIATAALLISTDGAGIEHLQRTQAWGALNVSPEHRTIEQLLILNRERGEISHVALLNATTPFRRAHNGSGTNTSAGTAAGTVEPVIALVDELLEPLPCDAALLQVQETLLGIASLADTTPLLITDVDSLYADATAWGDAGQGAEQITAAIVDQLILHQRIGNSSSTAAA
jgi:hypothetical protein